jgi:cysteinyl-tRNA synthetase
MAALFTFVNKANAELDRGGSDREAIRAAQAAFDRVNSVLDIVPDRGTESPEFRQWVESRLAARRDARARRDFAEADSIRKELEAEGIAIEDSGSGTTWKRVR